MPACIFKGAMIITETKMAILVKADSLDEKGLWVPKSVIHDDSEVFDQKHPGPGQLVIKGWWADRENLTGDA